MLAGQLTIEIAADVARIKQDMARANDVITSGARSMSQAAAMAARSLGLIGVGLSGASLASFIRDAVNAVDAMNDLADATGASVENISALERVARSTGASMDTVGQGLLKFNTTLATTAKAGSDAEGVLKALGLNAKELRATDPAEALRLTAVALSQFADDGEKARAIQELFGKSTREVAAFLKDLAESGGLVATVTKQQTDEAERFNKELFKLQMYAGDAGRAIAMELVPRLNSIFDTMRDSQPVVYNFWDEWMNGLRRVTPGVALLADLMRAMSMAPAAPKAILQDDITDAISRRRGSLPTLALPPEPDKEAIAAAKRAAAEAVAAAKKAAEDTIREAMRAAQERQRLRIKESEDIRQFELEQEATAKRAAEARKEQIRVNSAEYRAGIEKQILAAGELVRAAQWENETYGMTRSQIAELTLARLEDAKAQALMTALTAEDVAGIQAQIDAQKRLIEIYRGGEVRDAAQKAATDTADAMRRANEQVGQSLTDELMRAGDLGSDYLERMFRTLVLRPLLSPIGSAVGTAIGSLPGGAAAGSGMLGSLASSGFGSAIMGGTSAFSSGLGAGFGALFGEAGITGALSAGATSIGAGSVMAGLGTIAGALGPIALGVMALGSMFDSKGGPKTEGGADLAGTIQQQYNGIAAQLGITNKAIFEAFYSKDPQGDSLTQLRVATMSGGRNVFERPGYENVGRSDGEFAAAVGDATTRAIIAALKDSDLADEYKQYLNALAADATTSDMQRAIDLIGQRKALDEEWLIASSTDAENLARARQRELDAMDPTLRAIKERIWAEQDLRRESEATASMQTRLGDALLDQVRTAESAARDAIARQDAAALSLRRYLAALTTGPMAALSPEAQYQASRSEFMRLSSLSLDDPERQSKLEEVGTAFLEASRSYNASSMAYFTDLAMVRGAVEASQVAAQTQADIGRMQLTALQSQYGMLSAINGSVIAGNLTVSAAIASLAGALSAAGVNGVRPTTPTGGGAADYYADNPAAAAPDPEGVAFWNAVEQSGAYRDMGYDSAQQWFDAHVAYLNGINGSHASGLDYVPFDGYRAELHQGERVLTASQARGQDAMSPMVDALLQKVDALTGQVQQLTAITAEYAKRDLANSDELVKEARGTASARMLHATAGVMFTGR